MNASTSATCSIAAGRSRYPTSPSSEIGESNAGRSRMTTADVWSASSSPPKCARARRGYAAVRFDQIRITRSINSADRNGLRRRCRSTIGTDAVFRQRPGATLPGDVIGLFELGLDGRPNAVRRQLRHAVQPVAFLDEAGSAPDAALDGGDSRAERAGEPGLVQV